MVRYMQKKEKVNAELCGLKFNGYVDAAIINNKLLETDVYVHPSYIENSSNAIAEAMLLGVPVVAYNVGGNPSMLCNDSGILIPANEPYMLAYEILKFRKREYAEKISKRALEVSSERQNSRDICNSLYTVYQVLLSEENN